MFGSFFLRGYLFRRMHYDSSDSKAYALYCLAFSFTPVFCIAVPVRVNVGGLFSADDLKIAKL